MRFLLKRKADGKFYRGREYRWEKGWTDIPSIAFLFQKESGAYTSHKPHWPWDERNNPIKPKCMCPRRKQYYRGGMRHVKSCELVAWQQRTFKERYEVIPVEIKI